MHPSTRRHRDCHAHLHHILTEGAAPPLQVGHSHIINFCILSAFMRPFAPQLARSINKSTSYQRASSIANCLTTPAATQQQQNRMSSSNVGELKIESTDIKTAPGVELSQEQRTMVGSVLDLFAGRPSLAKLQLWRDDAIFTDPINHAKGRKEFEAQWVRASHRHMQDPSASLTA